MASSIPIALVAAMGANRVIGDGPRIPWRIPGEQAIFRGLTEGNSIVMGRKTYESIGRPLPRRQTLVLTRKPGYAAAGCIVVGSLDEAIAQAAAAGHTLFVAGGGEVYALALPVAQRIHLTTVHRDFEGDVHFPSFSPSEFKEVSSTQVSASIPYTYAVYERVGAAGGQAGC